MTDSTVVRKDRIPVLSVPNRLLDLPVCEVRMKLGVSGACRCQQNLRLDPRSSQLKPKRREETANAPVGSPGHRVDRQTGLQLLCIGKVGIGDAAERRP